MIPLHKEKVIFLYKFSKWAESDICTDVSRLCQAFRSAYILWLNAPSHVAVINITLVSGGVAIQHTNFTISPHDSINCLIRTELCIQPIKHKKQEKQISYQFISSFLFCIVESGYYLWASLNKDILVTTASSFINNSLRVDCVMCHCIDTYYIHNV